MYSKYKLNVNVSRNIIQNLYYYYRMYIEFRKH